MAVVVGPTVHRVEIKAALDEEWTSVDFLRCVDWVHQAAPGYGRATFRWYFGNILDSRVGPGFVTRTPINLEGYFIRVFAQYPDDPEYLLWVGVVSDQTDQLEKITALAGVTYFQAFEMPFLWDRIEVIKGVCLRDGDQQVIHSVPAFNRRGKQGQKVLGNRSTDPFVTTPVDLYLFDNIDEQADPAAAEANVWNALQAVHYLIVEYTQSLDIEWVLDWPDGILENFIDVWEVDGKTLWGALNTILDRRYGMCLDVWVDESDQWNLTIRTVTKDDITIGAATIPANDAQKTLTLPGPPEGHIWGPLSMRLSSSSLFDSILVRGNKIKVMGTFGWHGIGTLDAGWASAIAADYDFPGFGADAAKNDQARAQDQFDGVYTKLVVPKTWDGQTGTQDGDNPLPFMIESSSITGVNVSVVGDWWWGDKTFDRHLLTRKGYDYKTDPPTKIAGLNSDDEFMPLAAWVFDSRDGAVHRKTEKWIPLDRIADCIPDLTSSCNVRPLDNQLGIDITCSPRHLFALNEWDIEGSPVSNTRPEFEWRDIVVTAAVEHDLRVQKLVSLDTGTSGRVLVIDADIDLWYVLPNTMIEVNAAGEAITYGGPAFLRDGRAKMDQILAAAVSWYGTPRQVVKIPIKRIRDWCKVGDMITEIVGQTLPIPINAVVTSIAGSFLTQSLTIETGWGQHDYSPDFGRLGKGTR